jgi:hypothetical protein
MAKTRYQSISQYKSKIMKKINKISNMLLSAAQFAICIFNTMKEPASNYES